MIALGASSKLPLTSAFLHFQLKLPARVPRPRCSIGLWSSTIRTSASCEQGKDDRCPTDTADLTPEREDSPLPAATTCGGFGPVRAGTGCTAQGEGIRGGVVAARQIGSIKSGAATGASRPPEAPEGGVQAALCGKQRQGR
jgi:hypothetical protein